MKPWLQTGTLSVQATPIERSTPAQPGSSAPGSQGAQLPVVHGTVHSVGTSATQAASQRLVQQAGVSAQMVATQELQSLTSAWVQFSMNPSTGSGGTCFGDSGGPHFLGGATSNLIVSVTVTGDAVCKATDLTYRLDTPSARSFLASFVSLP